VNVSKCILVQKVGFFGIHLFVLDFSWRFLLITSLRRRSMFFCICLFTVAIPVNYTAISGTTWSYYLFPAPKVVRNLAHVTVTSVSKALGLHTASETYRNFHRMRIPIRKWVSSAYILGCLFPSPIRTVYLWLNCSPSFHVVIVADETFVVSRDELPRSLLMSDRILLYQLSCHRCYQLSSHRCYQLSCHRCYHLSVTVILHHRSRC
jgi:hypothetical protein